MVAGSWLQEQTPKTMRALLVFALVVALLAPASALAAQRLCTAPLDVSGTRDIPAWVRPVKENDAIAYPAHVLLGTVLQATGCTPAATAVQWLKAAAHARTPDEVAQAAAGIREARARGDLTTEADRQRLCAYVRGPDVRPEQRAALAQADLNCG